MPLRLIRKECVQAARISGAVAVNLTITSKANARVAGASLTCMQEDSAGAFIPKAQAAITDVTYGVVRTVSAGGADLYPAPNQLPGTYAVRTTAIGFSTVVQRGVPEVC
jgi:hypothetical protein